jgi:hypothetical protein
MKAFNSLPQHEKDIYIQEATKEMGEFLKPAFKQLDSLPNTVYTIADSSGEFKQLRGTNEFKKFNNLRTKGSTLDYNQDYINVRTDEACGYWSRRYFEKKTDFNKIHLRYTCSR